MIKLKSSIFGSLAINPEVEKGRMVARPKWLTKMR